MKIKTVLIIINILAIIGTLIWLKVEQTWEPLVAVITGIGTLLALLFADTETKSPVTMKQKGGKNSTNYQAGGDININK